MTREEIDRHVAGILALRAARDARVARSLGRQRAARARYDRGSGTPVDYAPARRVTRPISRDSIDADVSPVDQVFTARQRFGWLPRGGDE